MCTNSTSKNIYRILMDIVEEIHQPPMLSSIMPSLNKRVHSPSPQKVESIACIKEKLRLRCINRLCKSGRNLTVATQIACDYYQITNKKNKEVCLKCLSKCINHYKRLTLKWQDGGCVLESKYPNYDKHYIIESSSSEEEEQQQQPMPSTSIDFSNKEDSTTADIIGQVIEKIFVNNKSHIIDQLELCTAYTQAKKKKRMSEMDSVLDMARNFENQVNTLRNKFCEIYTPNSHVLETVDLGTLNKSYLKSVANKTKYFQNNKLKIHREIKLKDPNIDKDVVLHSKKIYIPPTDLPNFGTMEYPLLNTGNPIYVMKLGFVQPWSKAKIMGVITPDYMHVEIDDNIKLCTTKEIAYYSISPVRFPVGSRVIAKFRKKCSFSNSGFNYNFYCGVIGEDPSTINTFRYLVFFDDGNVQYRKHKHIRLVAHKSSCISNDVHPDLQEFIKSYLEKYPVRQMVKLTEHNYVRAKYKKRWEVAKVMTVDAALVQLYFTDLKEYEWLYRGSSRLWNIYEKECKSEKGIRLRQSGLAYLNKPFVECTSLEESAPKATARKSTSKSSTSNKNQIENNMLNQHINLYETKAIKLPENVPRPKRYTIHNCNHSCVDWTTFDHQKTKTISMLSTPLHFGFKRCLVYFNSVQKCIIYKTPCGKRIRNMKEMFNYLIITKSKITIDQFDFSSWVNTLNEFKVLKLKTFIQDLSSGQELKGISVVNNIDNRLPPSMVYLNSRRAMPGVEINLDSNFLCGCDCTDNCQDKSKCACWQLTIEGQKVLPNPYNDPNIGYNYRRLPERVITGIYECNKNCKCSSSCLNRVVQYPLSQKLQLFLTEKKGWGVRCLNDIPQGSFICVYVGYLLTESDANEGGMNYGDEYLAELDYIEVLEKIKEDYESDLPISDEEESDNNENDDSFKESDTTDEDYQSTSEGKSSNTSDMSLRKRESTINSKTKRNSKNVPSKLNSDNKQNNPEPPKSVREYFGTNESVYIMDAKTSGNIGRYLNHSCCPNTFVQNVFVDTHDLRFPWISFFALHYIPAGTELTWDYSYEIGSVPGKVMKCHCGSVYCRGRLL